ncbi:MAG TPA: hypothetical protein VGL02_01290 [Streptomyces sp.]
MDRLTYLATRDQRTADTPKRTLAEAMATDVPAWYRIHVQYSRGGTRLYRLEAWTADHRPCAPAPGITAQSLMAAHPDIDWWRSHDVDARTGAVYAVPEPDEDGAIPELDRTFGDRRPPHYLCDRYGYDRGWFGTPAHEPRRAAA